MKKVDQICNQQSCYLCQRCSPDWLLTVSTHKETRKFKKGALIFQEGTTVEGIFFIYSGKVKIHMRWGQEKDLIVRFARQGDIVGYRGLGNGLVYPVSATALEDVVVCFVKMPFFESTLQVNPSLTYALMKFYASELQDTERRMRNLVHMEVKGRVAETLLMLKTTFGLNMQGEIDILLTKQDIASYAGTTYETFFRTANELAKENIINISGKHIALINEEKLKELSHYGL